MSPGLLEIGRSGEKRLGGNDSSTIFLNVLNLRFDIESVASLLWRFRRLAMGFLGYFCLDLDRNE